MALERRAGLFKNGRNQALGIPGELALSGDEVIVRNEGHRLSIEPAAPASLLKLLECLAPIEGDFGDKSDMAPEPVGS